MNTETIQIVRELRDIITKSIDTLNAILGETETKTVKEPVVDGGMEWSTKKGKWVRTQIPASQTMDAVIKHNQEVRAKLYPKTTEIEPVLFDNGIIIAKHFELIRTNSQSRYWKIMVGQHKGAVVKTPIDSLLVMKDGRYGMACHGKTHIAITSYDKDGRDYVNRVIRKDLNTSPGEHTPIRRMYRPKGFAGRYSHCDIYLG